MDIHGKSVDMGIDGKFHIHGKPAVTRWRQHILYETKKNLL